MSRGSSGSRVALFLALLTLTPLLVATPEGAVAAPGAPLPSVTESSGCGELRTFPPLATRSGRLARTEKVGGPYGALFGRTIGEVEDSQVWWTVPMSGGRRILVHRRALPAFERVAANLAAAAAQGRWYPISVVRGQSSRTVAGKFSMSYHAFGAAVDVNPAANPYRADNVLITDMPAWFVQAWRDAGFCWGGDWVDFKDAMHFSWRGPLPTPGYPTLPDPYPTHSPPARFTQAVIMPSAPFRQFDESRRYLIEDAAGRGAPDVVQLVQHELGVVVNVARAHTDYSGCAVQRGFAFDARLDGRTMLMGDFQGSGRSDLWEIDASAGTITVTIHAGSELMEKQAFISEIAPEPTGGYLAGDWDGDGRDDLYVIRQGTTTRLEVWTAASGFTARALAADLPAAAASGLWRFALGDRDVDGRPDLYLIDMSGPNAVVHVFTHADGYGRMSEGFATAASVGIGGLLTTADHDGDGRADLVALNPDGSLRAFLGNQPVSDDAARWYRDPAWECEEDSEPFVYAGTFRDDDSSPFQTDIQWLAAAGVTKGCNWPYGDEFCPERWVTRAEMATFLTRALGLEPIADQAFLDVSADAHAPNIGAIAAAGITRGCAPDGSLFCPERLVSRAEMATFLTRALGLEPIPGQTFLDVSADAHAPNINAIAAAGITRGCVPDGSLYCPYQPVARGQMAAFLYRALGTG